MVPTIRRERASDDMDGGKGYPFVFSRGYGSFFSLQLPHFPDAAFSTVQTALFEGPLDEESMQKVLDAGLSGGDDRLLNQLDKPTLNKIQKL